MKILKAIFLTLITVVPTVCLITWDTNIPTSYIFAPGIFESERYAACYCSSYKASTGEVTICKKGIIALQGPCTSITFDEVVLDPANDKKKRKSLGWGAYALTKGQTARRLYLERQRDLNITGQSTTNVTVRSWQLDNSVINFGQERDIELISTTYDKHIAKFPNEKLVLYGFSRGAAAIFNFAATDYQNKKEKKVAACVLEACYDVTPLPSIFNWLVPGYDPHGIQPRLLVKDFPKDTPVLFITSAKDTKVSAEKSWKLYFALKKTGHQHLYIIELENSNHPGYTYEDETDRTQYQALLHAFYKKYSLAYIPELAQAGQELLANAQP